MKMERQTFRNGALTIEKLSHPVPAADFARLSALLRDCVEAGASIGFVTPLGGAEVEAFWEKVANDVKAGTRIILVAREAEGGPIVGSAQLALGSRANGRHRAEVQKVMVFPEHRRRGVAAALMSALEEAAGSRGVTLLHLDTSEGRGGARDFYAALGYCYVGGIPGYALDPDGTPARNAIYYKELK